MILHLPSSSFFDLQQHHLITILMSKQYPHHLRKWMYDMHGWITKTERKKERGKTRTGRRRRRRKRRMRGQEKEMGKGIRNAYNAATLLTSDWLYWTYTRKKRIIHRKEKRKKNAWSMGFLKAQLQRLNDEWKNEWRNEGKRNREIVTTIARDKHFNNNKNCFSPLPEALRETDIARRGTRQYKKKPAIPPSYKSKKKNNQPSIHSFYT